MFDLIISVLVICIFVFLLCVIVVVSGKLMGQSGEAVLSVNDTEQKTVKRGQRLIDVLADNRIFLPAACGGKGNCGRCKLIVSGGGPVTALEKIALTENEIKQGFRLGCQVKVRNDIGVKVPEELLNVKGFRATLVKAVDSAYHIKTLFFKLNNGDKLCFKAGQYVQITHEQPRERYIRAYSISSSPSCLDTFSLDVQLVENGTVSSYLHSIEVGSEIDFTGPYGDMWIDDFSEDSEVLLLAGGVGIAPMKSIVAKFVDAGYVGKLVLFHGARSMKYLLEYDDLKKTAKTHKNFIYIPVLSEPALEDGWTENTGMVHEALENWLKCNNCSTNSQAYICGPTPMMNAVTNVLMQNNFTCDRIHTDPFT